MKTRAIKLCALFLASLMLLAAFAACTPTETTETEPKVTETVAEGTQGEDGTETETGVKETETTDPNKYMTDALNGLGTINYGGKTLGIICGGEGKNEVEGLNEMVDSEGGTAQVINDAVYARNQALEQLCNLTVSPIKVEDLDEKVRVEAMSPSRDFQFIDSTLDRAATNYATNAFLSDWISMGIDLDQPWWDAGTADFLLEGSVYFMSGSLNYVDDLLTYVIIFNKEMRENYKTTISDPYQSVRNNEWTLDYFYQIIQGVSRDSAAPSGYDELDTYGFVTNWEYGNTIFLGSDLRYIINNETVDGPTLYLSDQARMEKALNVLDMACKIVHENNATYMSPAGQESLGVTAFQENRALFFGEAVTYIQKFNREMKGDYGILPVPKYDQAQENYRTWTHSLGTTFSIVSTIPTADREVVGKIMSAYAILSHQHLKPAFYDTVLTSRSLRDPDSVEMMDMIFSNRVYDMAFYFRNTFTFEPIFKNCVVDDLDTFSSQYKSASKGFDRKLNNMFKKLNKN